MAKDENHRASTKNTYTWMIVAAVVVLLLLFFFLIPAYKGYKTYRALKSAGVDESYVSDMESLASAKENAESRAAAAEQAAKDAQARADESATAKSSADSAREACETQAAADKKLCGELADSLAQEKADAENEFRDARDSLESAANQLCCVRKVFDAAITGYDIDDGKIECVDSGGDALSC